jgi:hypothetical protein
MQYDEADAGFPAVPVRLQGGGLVVVELDADRQHLVTQGQCGFQGRLGHPGPR